MVISWGCHSNLKTAIIEESTLCMLPKDRDFYLLKVEIFDSLTSDDLNNPKNDCTQK